jgi:hypothetical protein
VGLFDILNRLLFQGNLNNGDMDVKEREFFHSME